MDRNPYAPPESNPEVRVEPPPVHGPEGLSGWLVLVGIMLVVTPLRLVKFLNETFPPLFEDGTWEVLTTPGPPPYHPMWGPLLITEIAANCTFIVVAVWLLVLFFRKSWQFPRVFVAFLVTSLLFIAVDALAVKIVLPEQPLLDGETMVEFTRSLVGAGIWIPYMLMSTRVKNTFVRTED